MQYAFFMLEPIQIIYLKDGKLFFFLVVFILIMQQGCVPSGQN